MEITRINFPVKGFNWDYRYSSMSEIILGAPYSSKIHFQRCRVVALLKKYKHLETHINYLKTRYRFKA